eukprot:CAMPEP_0174841380 /NCGR_PEP_ID=MMETSP1114-20130205/9273_1 /TAXON_ID=312471 /ORGANISM="Neobodo designis, Strain CCAP 1951/1" /LENGTH=287 /DNA_ID=CAMNT_0016075561 /DNA_START=487 /DNA_END=1347 /DNA_ORIENTATION=-
MLRVVKTGAPKAAPESCLHILDRIIASSTEKKSGERHWVAPREESRDTAERGKRQARRGKEDPLRRQRHCIVRAVNKGVRTAWPCVGSLGCGLGERAAHVGEFRWRQPLQLAPGRRGTGERRRGAAGGAAGVMVGRRRVLRGRRSACGERWRGAAFLVVNAASTALCDGGERQPRWMHRVHELAGCPKMAHALHQPVGAVCAHHGHAQLQRSRVEARGRVDGFEPHPLAASVRCFHRDRGTRTARQVQRLPPARRSAVAREARRVLGHLNVGESAGAVVRARALGSE